jgi:hypothetical protein
MPDAAGYLEPEALWTLARKGTLNLGAAWALFRVEDLKALGGFHIPLRWLADWYFAYALGLSRGICWTGVPSAVMRYHSKSYSVTSSKRPQELRLALDYLAELLIHKVSRDVRLGFGNSGVLGRWGTPVVGVMLSDRRRWHQLSLPFWYVLFKYLLFNSIRSSVPAEVRRRIGKWRRQQTTHDLTAMCSTDM